MDKISNWLMKDVHPTKVTLEYIGKVRKVSGVLSDDCVFRLFQNNSDLKTFELNYSCTSS